MSEPWFLGDLPSVAGEVAVEFVLSPVACGRLVGVDSRLALDVPGVLGVYTASDVPGAVRFGAIFADEAFLADGRVEYCGQPVALIAAESRAAAVAAARLVRVLVDEEEAVLSIEAAIERGDWLGEEKRIECGDAPRALASAEFRLSGTLRVAGQEHCYLETQGALAEVEPGGLVRVKSSTQHPSEIQRVTALMLGLGMHDVVVDAVPMGGGFGGKETQAAIPAMASALVAFKTRRPARVVLSRRTDMAMTGKRHEYRIRWEVGFDGSGRIGALDLEFYSNGGCAADLSPSVMERSLFHATNAYYVPDVRLRGRVCRTNYASNTAFRGFGAPQAVAAMEAIVEAIAEKLGKDAYDIRAANCFGCAGRDVTPYGQRVTARVGALMEELAQRAEYRSRVSEVEAFNRQSRTHLRGISLVPVHFGISFTKTHLNQANALVNLFLDGTVQVSTGATEMGQGSGAKIRQMVADAFGVSVERVRMMGTSTEKNHNTSATAASVSTDLNGMAALQAAGEIAGRLRAVAGEMLGGDAAQVRLEDGLVFLEGERTCAVTVGEVARAAHAARVDLGARGFYKTPEIDFDWSTGRGRPFRYFTTGCAVSEVSIERWSGTVRVERVDVLMDIGASVNPAIDRGQIHGGFVQGMGWALMEELVYDGGRLTTDSMATYKIPGVGDVPEQFRVELVDRGGECIVGGKGVGEPPFLLGLSVWTAVRSALSRMGNGEAVRLDLPATPARVLMEMERLAVK